MAEARIVVVNFNAGENLRRCMAALLAQTQTDFEVRIVDNASTGGEPEVPPDEMIKSLAAAAVSDEASLNSAALSAELQYSSYVRENVDVFSRVNANH